MIEPHEQRRPYTRIRYNLATLNANKDPTRIKEIMPMDSSLNRYFVKEGKDFIYCGFQEPWRNLKGERVPGSEIFFEQDLYIKKGLFHCFST